MRKMQTRLMSNHGIRLAIGSLALCFANAAGSQESLERGKSAAQLYAANCAGCHKSPQSVTKATGIFDLESFLREHYTPSPRSAATLAAYLKGLERPSSGARGDAQYQPPPPLAPPPQRSDTFTPDEVMRAGHNLARYLADWRKSLKKPSAGGANPMATSLDSKSVALS